ncbi:Thioredoxin-like protein [compost metagenome]
MNTQDFILSPGGSAENSAADGSFPKSVKYGDILHPPRGFNAFFDLEEGLAYAKLVNKPIMLDFTGHTCVNCRRMEDEVWVKPSVGKLIKEGYVLIQLYADDRSIKMPADKVHYSKILRRQTDDLGRWNLDFQATKYGANSQPYYVLVDHDLNPLVEPQGAIFNEEEYAAFLQSGLDKFKALK